jgi:hypothetical protein
MVRAALTCAELWRIVAAMGTLRVLFDLLVVPPTLRGELHRRMEPDRQFAAILAGSQAAVPIPATARTCPAGMPAQQPGAWRKTLLLRSEAEPRSAA